MAKGVKRYSSWGRYPKAKPKRIEHIFWRDQLPDLSKLEGSILPFGYGRSYGDSCLNDDGVLVDTTGLRQMMSFDEESGLLRCEAGVTLADILDVMTPKGWFLAVTPGTKYVSVAGAIANDVHGKNHHVAGTFGCHVTQFELLRSDGTQLICSSTQNSDLFKATIGGLGLTGVILWAEFRLKKIPSPLIKMENIRYNSLDAFFELNAQSEKDYSYLVSWVDCSAQGAQLGRGHYQRGNFYDPPFGLTEPTSAIPSVPIPIDFPTFAVNRWTINAFNWLYYHRQPWKVNRRLAHYNTFFYPLDALTNWYRGYGKNGFVQYQFVMPYHDLAPLRDIFTRIAKSGQGSPLVVFKTFGDMQSPGMLSFPRAGVTLALDFALKGPATLKLLDELDEIVFAHGGRLYPAKDARMSPKSFRLSYPNWEEFSHFIDPKFSSSFWRRVTG